ncbi:hypothetical protein SAMN05421670_2684 [Psychrobacillus psychrotolerans]|uniref:Uncharacterized protein n=1 Tax=Psychrobacillus psychrotolerans TaxID=126156 RepID=A0A1I5ZH05_9BACI|nr:hypothetical protein [Psychrobacillus psychrotolerans]SFQ55725.1 hypothetical protein SAMN05421670_2684 [Psychrobacillus psychrotolerans]
MLKTVKGKVIAGTVAVTLFAGAGAAFGASDAGTNLKSWYDGQFGNNKSAIEGFAVGEVGDFNANLTTIYNERKAVASARIETTKGEQIDEKNSSITAQATEHIDSVNEKKNQISALMESQFDKLFKEANKSIQNTGNEALKNARTELPGYIEGLGTSAISGIDTELKETTEQAITELEAAIATAKGSLERELKTESDLTEKEIIAAITAKTAEVRQAIVELRNKLVIKQQELIVKEAKKLENKYKDQLQGIVDAIK